MPRKTYQNIKPMNIWILNHYAGPPSTTPATRTFDLSKKLAQMGHRLTIFACSFNHYSFAEEQLKPFQLFRLDELDGVRFVWIRGIPYKGNGGLRFLNMLGFALLAFLVGLWLRPRPHIIIGVTVHPLAPASAFFISRFRGSRFWLDITDIWPQSLVELGHLSPDGPVTKVMAALEQFALRRAELVTSVLPNIAQYVRDRGWPHRRTAWIPNGIDRDRASPITRPEIPNNTTSTVAWAGGFAPAHALDVILDAAAILQANNQTDIQFILIGDGPEMGRVKQRIKELALTNITLTGFIPKQELYTYLARADCFLVTGKNLPVYRYGVSYNKIFDYLLVGRPVIFAINAHNNPVAQAGAGLSVPAEDPHALAQAIVQIHRMPLHAKQEMGRRARRFVTSEFDYTVIAQRLEKLFRSG